MSEGTVSSQPAVAAVQNCPESLDLGLRYRGVRGLAGAVELHPGREQDHHQQESRGPGAAVRPVPGDRDLREDTLVCQGSSREDEY